MKGHGQGARGYLIEIMEFLKGVYKTVTTFQHHDFNYNTGKAAPLFSAACGGIFYTCEEIKSNYTTLYNSL